MNSVPGVQWRDPDLHEVIEFLSNPNSVIKVRYLFIYIYTYKVVISFDCLYVRSQLRNLLTDLSQFLIGELGRTTGMFLACLN